jgi:guanine deaminase
MPVLMVRRCPVKLARGRQGGMVAAMDDEQYLRQAIALSRRHMEAGDGGPFGAVVVRGGRMLGEGWNQVTSALDPTAHAEVVAIRMACLAVGDFALTGAVLYASCEPCPMCLAAAWWARVDAVVYAASREDAAVAGFDDAELYREVQRPVEERKLPCRQLLRGEAVAVFGAWLSKTDRIPY